MLNLLEATPGYIKLNSPNYTKPTTFLFDGLLPLVPPIYSTDPTVLTVYGQGANIDVYCIKLTISKRLKKLKESPCDC